MMLKEQHPLTHQTAGIPVEYAILPRKDVIALMAALSKYSRHLNQCCVYGQNSDFCDCGLMEWLGFGRRFG